MFNQAGCDKVADNIIKDHSLLFWDLKCGDTLTNKDNNVGGLEYDGISKVRFDLAGNPANFMSSEAVTRKVKDLKTCLLTEPVTQAGLNTLYDKFTELLRAEVLHCIPHQTVRIGGDNCKKTEE